MANLARELMLDLVPNYPTIEIVRPIQASNTVYQGNWITIDTSYNVGTWTAGERTCGICKQTVDNASGAAAADGKDVKIIVGGAIRWYIASTTEADIGKAVFNITDNNTLSLTPRAGGYVGKIIDCVSGLCTILLDATGMGRDTWETWFDIADDGTVALPDATAAEVMINDGTDYLLGQVTSAGAVAVYDSASTMSANADDADTDTKLCLIDAGTYANIKNRKGATTRVFCRYNGCFAT